MISVEHYATGHDTSSGVDDMAGTVTADDSSERTESAEHDQLLRVGYCPGQRVRINSQDQRFPVDFWLIRTQIFY